MILALGDVESAAIKVILSGKEVSTLRWALYSVEITDFLRNGKNKLQVIAATTLFNLMGPGWIQVIEEESVHFTDFSRYTGRYTLLPFGMGKARIWELEE